MDCVGSQALYENSPRYLCPGGPFVNIGAFDLADGILTQMFRWFMNSWRPTWLGGIPRPYIMFSKTPNMAEVLTLVELVEQGKLKVILDSEFEMEDLIKGYERVTSKRARGKVLIRVHGV
jgi:NADPH:quinone reductase-like Zn-dependent oxidoreductase